LTVAIPVTNNKKTRDRALYKITLQCDRGTWIFTPYSEDAIVELTSVNLEMPMSAIYEDVVLAVDE